jgi:hypothetical protein
LMTTFVSSRTSLANVIGPLLVVTLLLRLTGPDTARLAEEMGALMSTDVAPFRESVPPPVIAELTNIPLAVSVNELGSVHARDLARILATTPIRNVASLV